jgi:hypothetical protein
MDWLTAVDPPKWGWTAIGGIQDVLPPHERARRVKKYQSLPMTKEQQAAAGEEVADVVLATAAAVTATMTTAETDRQCEEKQQQQQQALVDGYYDNLIAGKEPRSSTTNQLLPNKALTTVMDTNHYFNPNTVARVTVRFPLGSSSGSSNTGNEGDINVPSATTTTAAAGIDQPDHITTTTRATSTLSRRSSTLSAASSSISLHGRNRTTTSTNAIAAATTANMEVDWLEETLDWDLGDPETLSPELFSFQVAQQFGLSWEIMMDLQFSIEQQLHNFIQHKINYRPPITVKDPSGLCNRLDDDNYSITQVVQHKSTPGISVPQYSSRSGYSGTSSSHIRNRPRLNPNHSFLSNNSESTHTANTRHHHGGGGGKAANSRRSRGNSSSANGPKASTSATTNTTEQSHSTSFTKQVLDRLKQQSLEQTPETVLVTPKNTVNAVCHICHARRNSCLLFACGISQHSYCSNHVLSRLETSVDDVCKNNDNSTAIYHAGFCPVCTVHCACAKCGRRLQRLLDYVASLCTASVSSSTEDVTTTTTTTDNNNNNNNNNNNIDVILTQLLPTLDLLPLAKGTKPIPENVEVLDSSDIAANIKRRRCEGTTTTTSATADTDTNNKVDSTTTDLNNINDSNNQNPEEATAKSVIKQKPEPKQLRPHKKSTAAQEQQLSEQTESLPRLRNVRTKKKNSFATSSSSHSSSFSEKEVATRKKRISVRKVSVPTTTLKADPFDFPYEQQNGELKQLPPGVQKKNVKIFNINVEETNEHHCYTCKSAVKDLQYFCCQCPRSFHSQCLNSTSQEPGIKWVCPVCMNKVEAQEDPFTGKDSKDLLISELIPKPPTMFDGDENKFQIICKLLELVLKLKNYDYAYVFSAPVDTEEVKDYFSFIETPMDLGTVERNIMTGFYYSPSMPERQTLTESAAHFLVPHTPLYCEGDEKVASEEDQSKEKGINYYSSASGATPITLTEAEEKTLLFSDTNGDGNNAIDPSPNFGNDVKNFIANIFSSDNHFTSTPSKPEETTTAAVPEQHPLADDSSMLLQESDVGDSSSKVLMPDDTRSKAANLLGHCCQHWNYTILSILKDIELIYHNCFVYNVDDTSIYRMGEVQRRKFHYLLKLHVEQDLDPSLLLEFQDYVRNLQDTRGESSQEKRRVHVVNVTALNTGPRPKSVYVVDPSTDQLIVSYSSTVRAFAACTFLKEKCGYNEDIRNYQWFAKNVKLGSTSWPLFGYFWLDTPPSNEPSENLTESLEFDNEELFEMGMDAALEDEEKNSQLEQNESVVDNSLFCCESENGMLGDILLIDVHPVEVKPTSEQWNSGVANL